MIAHYTGQAVPAATPDSAEIGVRWGTGEAQIVRVELSSGGEPVTEPTTLDPLDIDIAFTAHRPLQDLVVRVRIDRPDGHEVWGTNTRRCGVSLGLVDGAASARVSIASLPLLEGPYLLSVGLVDHSETIGYDQWDHRIRFDVRQYKAYDTGTVHIPVEWSISGARGIVQGG